MVFYTSNGRLVLEKFLASANYKSNRLQLTVMGNEVNAGVLLQQKLAGNDNIYLIGNIFVSLKGDQCLVVSQDTIFIEGRLHSGLIMSIDVKSAHLAGAELGFDKSPVLAFVNLEGLIIDTNKRLNLRDAFAYTALTCLILTLNQCSRFSEARLSGAFAHVRSNKLSLDWVTRLGSNMFEGATINFLDLPNLTDEGASMADTAFAGAICTDISLPKMTYLGFRGMTAGLHLMQYAYIGNERYTSVTARMGSL